MQTINSNIALFKLNAIIATSHDGYIWKISNDQRKSNRAKEISARWSLNSCFCNSQMPSKMVSSHEPGKNFLHGNKQWWNIRYWFLLLERNFQYFSLGFVGSLNVVPKGGGSYFWISLAFRNYILASSTVLPCYIIHGNADGNCIEKYPFVMLQIPFKQQMNSFWKNTGMIL